MKQNDTFIRKIANIVYKIILTFNNYISIIISNDTQCCQFAEKFERGVSMNNKRGYTVQERLKQDIEYAKIMKDKAERKLLATKALGAVDLAVEFGLITYNEWERHIEDIFKIA